MPRTYEFEVEIEKGDGPGGVRERTARAELVDAIDRALLVSGAKVSTGTYVVTIARARAQERGR